jgi:hypothetical protein
MKEQEKKLCKILITLENDVPGMGLLFIDSLIEENASQGGNNRKYKRVRRIFRRFGDKKGLFQRKIIIPKKYNI